MRTREGGRRKLGVTGVPKTPPRGDLLAQREEVRKRACKVYAGQAGKASTQTRGRK